MSCAAEWDNDTALDPFLAFLARDIELHPEAVRPVTPEFAQRVRAITKDVEIDLEAPLSPDDE
jgi:antitoxin PrlF